MYPVLCYGGYPFPIKAGMRSIVGVMVTPKDTSEAARITILDSNADSIVSDSDSSAKTTICDLKGIAGQEGTLSWFPPKPIKVVNGISISSLTSNLSAGKVLVFQD